MDFVDVVLNLAGLLLWLNWRSERLDAAYRVPVISLAHVVRKAGSSPMQKWKSLALLGGLLLLRALLYWQFGGTQPHIFKLDLTPIAPPFRSNHFGLMLLYSALSFLFVLVFFHFALLLLSLINGRGGEKDAVHRFVRVHLGWLDRLPTIAKWLLPCFAGTVFWMLSANAFAGLNLVSAPRSFAELWQQSALIGVGVYLHWRWVILGVLLLYLVNTYVYLGRLPIWEYIQTTGRNLIGPLRFLPLQIGKVDLAPVVGMALVSALTVLLESGWHVNQAWVPQVIKQGVLPYLYAHVPY